MATSLKLLFTIFIAILHRSGLAQVTHPDEIEALKTIANKLGKAGLWNFSVDPCTGGNSSWSTGDDWQQNKKLKTQDLPGVIPPELADLTYLEEIDLTRNYLNGLIPAALESLTSLRTLCVGINRLSGHIPKELGNLSNLERLVISSNYLYGTLPPKLGNLTALALKTLFLGNNQLMGQYPFELTSNIKNIDLSFNNLSGQISPTLIHNNNVNLTGNFFYTNSTYESRTQGCLRRSSTCHKEDPKYTSLAINCGGPQLNTPAPNIFFEADNESLGPSSFYMSPRGNWAVSAAEYFMGNSSIKNYTRISDAQFNSGLDPRLYMTARLSPFSVEYCSLRLQNGRFAKEQISGTYASGRLGQRIFDVYIQGARVLKDCNTKGNAGDPNAVVIQAVPANVTENINSERPKRNQKNVGFIIGMIIVSVFALIVSLVALIVSLVFFKKIKKIKRRDADFARGNKDQELSNLEAKSNRFSLRELKTATNGFHPDNKIGEGGFGAVYKGITPDAREVAIKQLSSKSKQGSREFLAEVGIVSAVQHPNVVKLYGCCAEGEELLLVYEYLENDSLASALFGTEPRLRLDWTARYNICIGVARGLAYLHEESRLRIVHRDIKSTNILLDGHLNPKITDFGLAKLFEEEKTHISTRVAGTVGYMAPEYALHGLLTEKADVYSFGMVALEVVSGRRNTDNNLPEEMACLVEWARYLYEEKKLLELVDVKLHSNYSEEKVMRVITVALLCTHLTPSLRPSMSTVVGMLEGKIEIPAPYFGSGDLWQSLARIIRGKTILEEPSATYSTSLRMDGPWQGSPSCRRSSFAKQPEKDAEETGLPHEVSDVESG